MMWYGNANLNGERPLPPFDWAADRITHAVVWGLPKAIMLFALFFDPVTRAEVWIAMLICMGGACLLNARRRQRIHCRYTGPFFIVMAAVVLAYIIGLLPLGDWPWLTLGLTTAVGNILLWWGPERLLGNYKSF